MLSEIAFKSYASNVGSTKNIRLIPLGVDTERFRPSVTVLGDSEKQPPTFIFVGAATKKKGFDVILESIDMLRSQGLSLRLLVVGVVDQSLLARRKHLTRNIIQFGMVPHSRLASILTTADCLLLPSRFESFGMVVTEAMACGLPVIVSEMVGARQLIDDGRNGFVVPVGCREALVDRMRWCIVNRNHLKNMSGAARATAERADWAAYRKQYIDAVREVLLGH